MKLNIAFESFVNLIRYKTLYSNKCKITLFESFVNLIRYKTIPVCL